MCAMTATLRKFISAIPATLIRLRRAMLWQRQMQHPRQTQRHQLCPVRHRLRHRPQPRQPGRQTGIQVVRHRHLRVGRRETMTISVRLLSHQFGLKNGARISMRAPFLTWLRQSQISDSRLSEQRQRRAWHQSKRPFQGLRHKAVVRLRCTRARLERPGDQSLLPCKWP